MSRPTSLLLGLIALTLVSGCARPSESASGPGLGASAQPAADASAAGSATSTEPAGSAAIPAPGTAGAAPAQAAPAADRPARIAIPSIALQAPLVTLGENPDGTLQVPTQWQQAGWFDRSALPGRQGPSVIAGHVDSKTGPAVFFRLAELRPGAQIQVTTTGGQTVSFRVTKVQRYAKTSFPTAAVYGPVPGPVLRLITCGGQFDRSSGHYRDNVVVFAA